MKILQLIALLLVISCSGRGKQPQLQNSMNVTIIEVNDSTEMTKISFETNDSTEIFETNDSIEMAKIALSFYDWYISGKKPQKWWVYASMDEDSVIALRNCDTYLGLLTNLGTLSERFLLREKERLDECNKYLADTDLSDADHGSSYAYAEGPCEWLVYDYWFQSQETPDEALLTKLEIHETTAIADIEFYSHASDGLFKQYYFAKEF